MSRRESARRYATKVDGPGTTLSSSSHPLTTCKQVKAAGFSSYSVAVNWTNTLAGRPLFDGKRKSCVKFTASWSDSARQ